MKPTTAELQNDEEIADALLLLKKEQGRFRWNMAVGGIAGTVSLLAFFIAILGMPQHAGRGAAWLLLSLLCLIVGVVRFSCPRSQALPILMKRPDLRAVGPLLEAQHLVSAEERRTILTCLCLLLPRLKASDAHLLTSAQRQLLLQELRLGDQQRETEYALAILKALEQVGGVEAIPVVRHLAEGGPESWQYQMQGGVGTWQEQRVREAAQQCLAALIAYRTRQRTHATLLRPASASRGELLRPVEERGAKTEDTFTTRLRLEAQRHREMRERGRERID